LLIATVFTGATIGVAKNNHIQVDILFRYLPAKVARTLATLVDGLRIAFFAAAVVLTIMMMMKLGNTSRMTMVELPMNVVYGVCLVGFALMCLRAVWVLLVHWRRGYSVLERPESTMEDR
jgi:TRAP-type transport system small permease protein